VRGLTETMQPGESHVGRKLSTHLVPQPGAELEVGQAGTDFGPWVRAAIKVHLHQRLQHEALRQQQLVLCLKTRSGTPFVAGIESTFGFNPLGSQPPDTARQPRPALSRTKILAYADLSVPPTRNHSVPEILPIGIADPPLGAVVDVFSFAA